MTPQERENEEIADPRTRAGIRRKAFVDVLKQMARNEAKLYSFRKFERGHWGNLKRWLYEQARRSPDSNKNREPERPAPGDLTEQ